MFTIPYYSRCSIENFEKFANTLDFIVQYVIINAVIRLYRNSNQKVNTNMKTKYCIISHTHWDREWYLPLEQFKMRLVDLIDNLLDILDEYPDYRFHLDAQTIVLEDYLSVKPDRRQTLENHIKSGHILVGPWYVQNDFNLTSGEATIRNLIIGSRIAENFGRNMMIGYAADQFGLVSQLPQIFKKFGIDDCIFGRGYSFPYARPLEFYWESPDGSQVLCEHMAFWYNNAQRFSPSIKESKAILNHIDNCIRPRATTSNFLLMNGVDHLEAEEDLPPIIDGLNAELPEDRVVFQDTFPEFMKRVRNELAEKNIELETYYGEMRNGGEGNVLTGTLSSRIYLKQWNAFCQALLEKKLEPLYAYLSTTGVKTYPDEYLRYLWKLLIENHPHDSICGCSVDAVHEHMMDRFKRIDEAGSELVRRGSQLLGDYIDRDGLTDKQYLINTINTTQLGGKKVLQCEVIIPCAEAVNNFTLTAADGGNVPYELLSKKKKELRILSPINLPGGMDADSFIIKFMLDDLPGMGYETLVLTPCKGEMTSVKVHSFAADVMENEYLKVTINKNGTVDLTEKCSGHIYKSALLIEDNIDHGDSYQYGANNLATIVTNEKVDAEIEIIENSEFAQIRKVTYTLDVKRDGEAYSIPFTFLLTLNTGSRELDVDIELINDAEDHRVRLLVPTYLKADTNYSGAPFDCIIRNRETTPGNERQPNTDYVGIDGENCGIAVLNQGIYEYENYNDEANTLALTLLRCTGMISGSYERKNEMNEGWLIPGNQCKGKQTYRLALYPYVGDHNDAAVSAHAQSFLCRPYAVCTSADCNKFVGGRPFVQGSDLPSLYYRAKPHAEIKLPRKCAFVELLGNDDNRVVISAYKKSEDGDSQIVRVFNNSDAPSDISFRYYKKINTAAVVNLDEKLIAELNSNENTTDTIKVGAKEIVTISIK